MIRPFLNANIAISRKLDSMFGPEDGRPLLKKFLSGLESTDEVADVGGGKKPVVTLMGDIEIDVARYDGFDIDINELEQAKHIYTDIFVLDLTKPAEAEQFANRYDKIICVSTLEHVQDTRSALKVLGKMLKPGGSLYVKIPNRRAVFAFLNRYIPNEAKRKMMHYVFPQKSGDGFVAYYDQGVPSKMVAGAQDAELELVEMNKFYRSTYFYFFVPAYLAWRFITLFQMLDKDYCESFEMIFRKR